MIMGLLSKGLGWATSSVLTLPLVLLVLLVFVHKHVERRDARITDAATQACNSSWLISFSKQQTAAARHEAEAARQILTEERKITEGLTHELEDIRTTFEAHKLAASNDPRCLSDSVLDALRRRLDVDGR